MRFAAILFLALVMTVGIFTFFNIGVNSEVTLNDPEFFGLIAMVLFPVVVLVIFAFAVVFHSPSIFNRRATDDALFHLAVGSLIAITADLSSGVVAQPSIYTSNFLVSLNNEIEGLKIYFAHGWQLCFAMHHNEHYEAHIVKRVTANDVVVEIDGIYDCFFEREGVQRYSPHENDPRSPLIRVPGLVRIRLVRENEQMPYKVAGFSENLRGLNIGLDA